MSERLVKEFICVQAPRGARLPSRTTGKSLFFRWVLWNRQKAYPLTRWFRYRLLSDLTHVKLSFIGAIVRIRWLKF